MSAIYCKCPVGGHNPDCPRHGTPSLGQRLAAMTADRDQWKARYNKIGSEIGLLLIERDALRAKLINNEAKPN